MNKWRLCVKDLITGEIWKNNDIIDEIILMKLLNDKDFSLDFEFWYGEAVHDIYAEIDNAKNLKEFIGAYEQLIRNTIDMSPYGLVRDTQKRMIERLKILLEKEKSEVKIEMEM